MGRLAVLLAAPAVGRPRRPWPPSPWPKSRPPGEAQCTARCRPRPSDLRQQAALPRRWDTRRRADMEGDQDQDITIHNSTLGKCNYRASHLVVDLVWLTWILVVPLSAQLCLGWWEFGRSGLADEQRGGTLKSKSTKPRSMTRWDTLYLKVL